VAESVSSPSLLQLSMRSRKPRSTLPPIIWSPSTNVSCHRKEVPPNPARRRSFRFWDSFPGPFCGTNGSRRTMLQNAAEARFGCRMSGLFSGSAGIVPGSYQAVLGVLAEFWRSFAQCNPLIQQQPIRTSPSGVTGGPKASAGAGAPWRTAIQRRRAPNATRSTPTMKIDVRMESR